MSINDKSVSTHNPDDGGLISATFPAIGELIVAIFGGCCCVMNCTQEQKDNHPDSIEGTPCCPQLNPPPTLKPDADGNPVDVPPPASDFELPEDEQPDGYEAPPPNPVHPPPPPPIYGGMCEQIKLQIGLHGTPYLKFAFAFEPILDIPPGLPSLPSLEIPDLFGFPSLNLPSIPLPGLGIPDLKIPGVDLPGIPSLKFFDLSIDPFPGMPLFNFSLFPISLGLDLFKLKLPAIPDFDLCKIAKFCKLIKEDTPCDANIPPIGINAALCWLMILLFFLMLIQPLLTVLLGMKEKGLLEEDAEGNITGVNQPPPIKIIHNSLGTTTLIENDNLIMFNEPSSGSPTRVNFLISTFELREMFGDEIFSEHSQAKQQEPNVQPETVISGSENFTFDWSVHMPPSEMPGGSADSSQGGETQLLSYADAFNAFKDSLITEKPLSQRILKRETKSSRTYDDRTFQVDFRFSGIFEVYCDVSLDGGESKTMSTLVQVGRLTMPTELPPILQRMPRYDTFLTGSNITLMSGSKAGLNPMPQPEPQAQHVEERSEPTRPGAVTKKPGV